MLKKLRPKEVDAHQRSWEEVLKHKRKILMLRQEQERTMLQRKVQGLVWTDTRARDAQLAVNAQRLKNHQKDLRHVQTLEGQLRPEITNKPSHLR